MVISKKTNFPRFQRGDGGVQHFPGGGGGGGGGPNANFYRNPLFPPLNTCMIYTSWCLHPLKT